MVSFVTMEKTSLLICQCTALDRTGMADLRWYGTLNMDQKVCLNMVQRQSNLTGHSFPQICYSLDFACSGSWLTAAFIFTYILQCIMGNYTVVTRNAPSRQVKTYYKSKTRSKHSCFHRPGTYYLSCNSPKYLFCALAVTRLLLDLLCFGLTQSQTKFPSFSA